MKEIRVRAFEFDGSEVNRFIEFARSKNYIDEGDLSDRHFGIRLRVRRMGSPNAAYIHCETAPGSVLLLRLYVEDESFYKVVEEYIARRRTASAVDS